MKDAAAQTAARGLTRRSKLEIRLAERDDIPALVAVGMRVYPDEPPYEPGMFLGQQTQFPEGQFVALYGGELVGFASTFQIAEDIAFSDHTWASISGGGHASRHDENGDWLYGMEVAVDPKFRRYKIGRRFYDARKRLAQTLGLKGVAFAGRLPGYARRRAEYPDARDYFQAVRDGALSDPVARFQLNEGFDFVRILRGYHPDDKASRGLAALMAWRNPDAERAIAAQPLNRADPLTARVTSAQLEARPAATVDEFVEQMAYFVEVASNYGSDFVLFPELCSLGLLARKGERPPPREGIASLADATPEIVSRLADMAVRRNINIVGGSHPTKSGDAVRNVAYACLRDGAVVAQDKLHPTPDEREVWGIKGGDAIGAFTTDCGPAAMMICYDIEFPELSRRVVDQGARLILTPYLTDTREGHLRVTLCAQARAIENQVFVATAGVVGNLVGVDNMDINYAQSGIYTPCDFSFARDGIAAQADANVEIATTADLDLSSLAYARAHGAVRNVRDRRFDLYRVQWTGPLAPGER